jgi:hypothetical protein
LEADYTDDVEQVNGLGVYSRGRVAIFDAAQKAVGTGKTVGLHSEIISAGFLADDVILAHVLSIANVPEGSLAGEVKFRFTLIIVNQGGVWKIRSSSTTLVRNLPAG